jgi:hypothetical protein
MFKNGSPIRRNNTIKEPEIKVARPSLMAPSLLFRVINTGMEPMISIMAKSVKVTVNNSFKLIFIQLVLRKGREWELANLKI